MPGNSHQNFTETLTPKQNAKVIWGLRRAVAPLLLTRRCSQWRIAHINQTCPKHGQEAPFLARMRSWTGFRFAAGMGVIDAGERSGGFGGGKITRIF
jgi:hypothetical protein